MTIKKGIPLPEPRRGRPSKYPFAEMEVLDCYEVEDPEQVQRATRAAYQHGARHGKKFAARSTPVGFRIWRIA